MKKQLQAALDELNKHDKMELLEKFRDSQSPKWERLLRDLVSELRGYGE